MLINQNQVKTLVLDLDETLVHSSFQNSDKTSFQLKKNQKITSIYVTLRPGALEFLQEMAKYYEIVIFTASQQQYCEKMIAELDPSNKYIDFQLSRNFCTMYQGVYVKDIRKLGRSIKDIIIIDVYYYLIFNKKFKNNPDCYLFSQENGYEIPSFFYDMEDKELANLIPFLLEMKDLEDVRAVEIWKEKFDEIQKASLENFCVSSAWLASENILEEECDSIEPHVNLIQNNYSKQLKPSKFIEDKLNKYNDASPCPSQLNLAQLEATLMLVTPEGVKTRQPLKRRTLHHEKLSKYLQVNKQPEPIECKTENLHEIRLKLNREELKISDIRFDISDINVMSPLNKNQFFGEKHCLVLN